MIVAICNFLFTLWSYKNTEKIEISFQAETDPYSKVELHDNDFLVILKNNGVVSGGFKTFKEMVPYIKEGDLCFPEALTFYVECKITNLSKKPVTISNIEYDASVHNPKNPGAYVGNRLFYDLIKTDGNRVHLPYLMSEQEQVIWFAKIGYPLTPELLNLIKKEIPNLKKIPLIEVYDIIMKHGFDLTDYPQQYITNMSIKITTANGKSYENQIVLPFGKLKSRS